MQADERGMLFMRHPPAGAQPLNSLEALDQHRECSAACRSSTTPRKPACAKGIADLYTLIGQTARASQWMSYYESRAH